MTQDEAVKAWLAVPEGRRVNIIELERIAGADQAMRALVRRKTLGDVLICQPSILREAARAEEENASDLKAAADLLQAFSEPTTP